MTPEQERLVRALLADARETSPMPDDVADRLDAVLADLQAQPPTASVTSLDAASSRQSRRPPPPGRRTRAARLVLAAAVVVVAGVGVGQAWRSGVAGVASDSAATAGSAGGQAESNLAPSQADGFAGSDQGKAADNAAGAPPVVRPDHLAADALTLRPSPTASANDSGADAAIPGCVLADVGAGLTVAVTYQGGPAVLVYRPVASGRQVVDLYPCGASEAVRSVTIPAP